MITEGGTSDEYYFNTLPASTPTDLHCETTSNHLTLTWSDPTTGMTENATYQFTYSLTESRFNSINIKCNILLLNSRKSNISRRAIITRSRFETALVYKPRILGLKNEEFSFLVHKWSVI